jgi:hypothetical protein
MKWTGVDVVIGRSRNIPRIAASPRQERLSREESRERERLASLAELEYERDPPLTARELSLELGCPSAYRTRPRP